MISTPRTDAFEKNPYVIGHQLWADFARTLEGQLTTAGRTIEWQAERLAENRIYQTGKFAHESES